MKEKKDRVDDALHATRAAVEEGVVAGGGVALIRANKEADIPEFSNDDQRAGAEIVRTAVHATNSSDYFKCWRQRRRCN